MHPTGSLENQSTVKLMTPDDAKELNILVNLLWGSTAKCSAEVFKQWSQGFVFSETEKSALVQYAGGKRLLQSLEHLIRLHCFRSLQRDRYGSSLSIEASDHGTSSLHTV